MRRCLCAVWTFKRASAAAQGCPRARRLSPLWLRTNMDVPTARPASRPPRLPHSQTPPSNSHQRKPFVLALFFHSLRGRPAVLDVSPIISQQLTMADAESSCTDTSLAHTTSATTQTSLLDSAPTVDHSSDRDAKNDRRTSLGLIDAARMRLSMDVSAGHAPFPLLYTAGVVPNTCYAPFSPFQLHTLLRSNSKSQRIRTVLSTQVGSSHVVLVKASADARFVHVAFQAEDPEGEVVYPNYAKVASHIVDLEVRSMDDTAEERTGRGFGARVCFDLHLRACALVLSANAPRHCHDAAMPLQHGCCLRSPLTDR